MQSNDVVFNVIAERSVSFPIVTGSNTLRDGIISISNPTSSYLNCHVLHRSTNFLARLPHSENWHSLALCPFFSYGASLFKNSHNASFGAAPSWIVILSPSSLSIAGARD
jgi:hypothetical protein